MKYKTRPIFVEAVVWDESKKTLNAIGAMIASHSGHEDTPDLCMQLRIETVKGTMSVRKGDYIIRNKEHQFYVIRPDLFHSIYEKA